MSSCPEIGHQLIQLIDLFDPHVMKNLYGKYRRMKFTCFFFSFPECDLIFVLTDQYIPVYWLSNSVTHEEIGETLLGPFSGLKKITFFEHYSIDFVQNGCKNCFQAN